MSQTYLPGTIRERIQDLMKNKNYTQAELAAGIGMTESSLSRFLSGRTDKLGDGNIIRIARIFRVSTDFLLGETDEPDRKNYDLAELGLSVRAAENLYTGKVSTDVVNCLLESPRFAAVTYMIRHYLDDTLASGVAAQNQMYATLGSLLRSQNRAAAADVAALAVPNYQADLSAIQTAFLGAVKEIKQEAGNRLPEARAMSKEATEKMFAELTRGQDVQQLHVTPEQVADSVTGMISGVDGVDSEALGNLNQALVGLMQSMVVPKDG